MHFETEHGKKKTEYFSAIIAFCGQMLPKSEQFRIRYTYVHYNTRRNNLIKI